MVAVVIVAGDKQDVGRHRCGWGVSCLAWSHGSRVPRGACEGSCGGTATVMSAVGTYVG